MTPQGILEDMVAFENLAGDRLETLYDLDMWKLARETVTDAVHFEFAAATPRTEHAEFAEEMMERGLFRLPFETVLYTGTAIPKTGIVCAQVAQEDRLTGLFWFVVAPAIDAEGKEYSLPLMVGRLDGRDHASGEPASLSAGTVDWKSMTTARHASRKTGRPWTEDDYAEGSERAMCFVLSGTALMMSKDVDTRVEPAPDKLNAARAGRGRPAVRERRIVVIRPEYRAHYANAAAEFAGMRSSPKMHWRRGHFRRVRPDLIVPVAPSVVGVREGVAIKPKSYEVAE